MDKKGLERILTGFFTAISGTIGIFTFLILATFHIIAFHGMIPFILSLAARLFLFGHLMGGACGDPYRNQEKTEQAYI